MFTKKKITHYFTVSLEASIRNAFSIFYHRLLVSFNDLHTFHIYFKCIQSLITLCNNRIEFNEFSAKPEVYVFVVKALSAKSELL